MTLLPDVERELLRVARRPLPSDAHEPERRASWRPTRLSGVVAAALTVFALALGGLFVALLHHGRSIGPSGHRHGPPNAFPGAPHTQGGDWAGGINVCPLAPPNRYLPARAGCVTALRADVDGDGRADLVLLYGLLSRHATGEAYAPRSFVLKVVRASGGVVTTRLAAGEADLTIVGAGHVSDEPGASLFIRTGAISSGSYAQVYTFASGRLTAAGPTLGYGGDSGAKAGFTCRAGHPPTIVQHQFVLEGPGENGRWQRTDTTYAWRGAVLKQIARRTSVRRGIPPASATATGLGCAGLGRVVSTQPRARKPSRVAAKCVAGELTIGLGQELSAATGEHGDFVVVRNRSNRACTIRGYPEVTLSYTGGRLLFVYRQGGGGYVTTKPPRSVVIARGGRAYVLVAKYRCDGRIAHIATKIRIALPAGAGTRTLALRTPGVSELDYCRRYPGDRRVDPGNYVLVSPIRSKLEFTQYGF